MEINPVLLGVVIGLVFVAGSILLISYISYTIARKNKTPTTVVMVNLKPKVKDIEIPEYHKQFMDQMIETYTKSLTELFQNRKNRGPSYHPDKIPDHIIELSVASSQLTLNDEWKAEYRYYITNKVNERAR